MIRLRSQKALVEDAPGVRFGSLADICAAIAHVGFAPESRHLQRTRLCLLWARSDHSTCRGEHAFDLRAVSSEPRPVNRSCHISIAQVGSRRTILLVFILRTGESILIRADVGPLRDVEVVEFGVRTAEDHVLDRTIGRTEWFKTVLLLHIAQCLDLPLRRSGPYRIGAPNHMIVAHTAPENSH